MNAREAAGMASARERLESAVLRKERCDGINLCHEDLRNAALKGALLTKSKLASTDLSQALLIGAQLQHAYLRFAKLHRADLRGADLRGANCRSADFRGAVLWFANLQFIKLHDANLIGADLTGAKGLTLAQLQTIRSWDQVKPTILGIDAFLAEERRLTAARTPQTPSAPDLAR